MFHDIKMEKIDTNWGIRTASEQILTGCIEDIIPVTHSILKGDSIVISADDYYHVFILASGSATFVTDGEKYVFDNRVTFAPAPDSSVAIQADENVGILEIRIKKLDGDAVLLQEYGTKFPYIMPYYQSMQYWDRHKTQKTIPRIMIEQRNIPRFCMGSCESYGYDEVIAHAHPMLDQYFFSFAENHTLVTIDDQKVDYEGNVLMYIPLGSKHGSQVFEGEHLHYVWIDYFNTPEGMNRLDTVHINTGKTRSFDTEEN